MTKPAQGDKVKFCKWVPFYGSYLSGDANIEQQCQEYRRTGEAIIKVIDFESYESLRAELEAVKADDFYQRNERLQEANRQLQLTNASLEIMLGEKRIEKEMYDKLSIYTSDRIKELEQQLQGFATQQLHIAKLEQENEKLKEINGHWAQEKQREFAALKSALAIAEKKLSVVNAWLDTFDEPKYYDDAQHFSHQLKSIKESGV